MARKRWTDLDPTVRRWIALGAVFEGALKIAALVDIARRPAGEIRGSKLRWACAVVLINSVGAVPILYFRRGRRAAGPDR